MSKDIGLSLMAGVASALVFLSVLSGGSLGVVLAYLMPLPIVMIGLGMGFRGLALGGGIALGLVALVTPAAIPAFAAIVLAPVVLVTALALRRTVMADGTTAWKQPGSIVAWIAVAAVGLMVLGVSLVAPEGGGIEEQARSTVTQFLDQAPSMVPADIKSSAVALWSALFPAMAGSAWLIMAAVNGLLAQWAVTHASRALRPTPDYGNLALPHWLLAALVLAAIVGALAGGDLGYLGRNACVVLLWPEVFVGLTVVHRTLKGQPHAIALLVAFYVVFLVVFGWALIAVAGLGLVRHWTRLRRERLARNQEDK